MTWTVRDGGADEDLAALFEHERRWAVYGLCDLDERYRSISRYIGAWRANKLEAAVLVFSPRDFTSLIPFGDVAAVERILHYAADLPGEALFQARVADIAALRSRFDLHGTTHMSRMDIRSDALVRPCSHLASIRRLRAADGPAATDLYRVWHGAHFNPQALETEVYFGAFHEGSLLAIAGTHALSVRYGVATVGGVLTHPAHRGEGLAGLTVSAVVQELERAGIGDVALNVKADNVPAIRAYARIGFRQVMPFQEGTLYDRRGT